MPDPCHRDQRINIVAPIPSDFKSVLEHKELGELWSSAVSQDARLSAEWIDEQGGTLGRKKTWQLHRELQNCEQRGKQ